jgi:hypothetical protein
MCNPRAGSPAVLGAKSHETGVMHLANELQISFSVERAGTT